MSPDAPAIPRELADSYVRDLADLNPILSTALGLRPHEDRMPDLSPAGYAAERGLAESTSPRWRPSAAGGSDRGALRDLLRSGSP